MMQFIWRVLLELSIFLKWDIFPLLMAHFLWQWDVKEITFINPGVLNKSLIISYMRQKWNVMGKKKKTSLQLYSIFVG